MFACLTMALGLSVAPLDVPALAAKVEADARTLAAEIQAAPSPERLSGKIAAFSDEAMALSKALREAGAASDLPCIFKGISEDARARANDLAAKDGAEKRFAVSELLVLFDDAEALAPQAAKMSAAPDANDPLNAAK
jgi:hypothetical protein